MLPENGYESPQIPDEDILFGQGILGGERRRARRSKSSDKREVENPDLTAYMNERDGNDNHMGDEEDGEKGRRRVGFRDRVGCYTWTWFTMTMATGGIANVLHSSKYSPIYRHNSFLMHRSSIPL